MASKNTSASAVSARLRKAGFGIVATRKYQGIRVSRGVLDEVSIEVDFDAQGIADRRADLVAEELADWTGYAVRRNGNHFYVSKAVAAK